MDKIKQALTELFDGAVKKEGLDNIMKLIQAKIDDAADAKLDVSKINMEKKTTVKLKEYKIELAKTIDTYLENANEEFVEENKHEIESELLVEMSTNIVHGLTDVLKKNNIEFPDSEVSVISDLEEKIIVLERRAEKYINENVEAKNQICEYQKAASFMQKTENLTESQKEKIKNIVTDINYDDVEIFNEKVDVIISEIATQKQFKTTDFDVKDTPSVEDEDYDTSFTDGLLR